jgi:hypothetical protein
MENWIRRLPVTMGLAVLTLGAIQMVPLFTATALVDPPIVVAEVVAGPLAQATATPTPTPTPTPTATPTLPPAHIYSDLTTGAVWVEQSFPRAGINCIVQTVGQAGGQFSCVPGTPVP